jgi:phosphate transport system substrate-binding protein
MMNKLFLSSAKAACVTAALGFGFASCSGDNPANKTQDDTPTSGNLTVYCDEGMQKQMGNQALTFESRYVRADIKMVYCNESEAVQALFNDSCKAIAMNRCLSKSEETQFKLKNIFIEQVLIGKNAVAVIVNKEAADSVLGVETLVSILAGDTAGAFKNVVFESEKASTALYCKDSLLKGKTLGKNCFAAKNVTDLVDRISQDKKAIGIIDYIWIADSDDSLNKAILSKVNLMPLVSKGNNTAYYPDQSNIETGDYPLTRRMYLIRRGQDFSLAAGFITYVAGPDGQVIMLKTGLAPWRQPERMISVDSKPIE